MASPGASRELKNVSYELFILLLSMLSLVNLVLLLTPRLDPIVKGVIGIMDGFVTVIFIVDFLYRYLSASSKRSYFLSGFGWADLLASLPLPQFKIFRVFRVWRVIRLMRELGARRMLDEILYHRSGSALYLTSFLVIVLLEVGGGAIVFAEANNPDANIKTASDGIWWSFVTMTTVGYGDRFPVSNLGRTIGMLTMALGVGLFGVLTGFLANAFVASPQGSAEEEEPAPQAGSELVELRRLLAEQTRVNAALLARLDKIENLLETGPPSRET